MKKLNLFSISLIVLLLMAASASAANEKYEYNYEHGYASWEFTDDYIYMYVDDGEEYTYISVYGYGSNYSFSGFATINNSETDTDVFTICEKPEPSASLSEFTFDVFDYNTYEYKPVAINIDWISDGDIATMKSMTMMKDDNIYKEKTKGFYSDAIATGSICLDGAELIGEEPSSYANFYSIDNVEMNILKK